MSGTIFALSTAPGRGGIAVVRVSGPAALESLQLLAGKTVKSRYATYAALKDPVSRETIDHALVLGFKAPHSFTGEDCAEYHLHGSPAVVRSLLDTLARQAGHRLAEPGEFTRRAFENGKIDLTEAEAIADLIDAQTTAQQNQALRQMEGSLLRLYEGWSLRLKEALAHAEADIEFPDEDLPAGIAPAVMNDIAILRDEIAAHLSDGRRGERLRQGLQVAVIGAPNAGKSSLVNALARREVAIVSDIPGTTRDVIEVHLDLDGYPVTLADTAGLRPDAIGSSGQDAIEQEGIRRALDKARSADIRLLVLDGTAQAPDAHTMALQEPGAVLVVNKCDLGQRLKAPSGAIAVSARSGQGLELLLQALSQSARSILDSGGREAPVITRQRHRMALEEAQESLQRAAEAHLPELAAEDMRMAMRAIGRITGRVDVEDLLDSIFRDFCVGK